MRPVEVMADEPLLVLDDRAVARVIAVLDATQTPLAVPSGELVIRWVTREESGRLHAVFFDDPEPTDIMTFPGEPEDNHAGDLAICPAIAAASAQTHGTTFAEELTLYVVHGWLHLAGEDDQTPEATTAMRAAEARAMQALQAQDAILPAQWRG